MSYSNSQNQLPLEDDNLSRPPWAGDKLLIRIIAVMQLLFTLFWLAMTPFVFNYGGASANPTRFHLWILFWLVGVVSGACLLSGRLRARVLALLWNGIGLCMVPSNGSWALLWFLTTTGYLLVTSFKQLPQTNPSPEVGRWLFFGFTLVPIAVLMASVVYAEFHTESALIKRLDSTSESARCSAIEELARKKPTPQVGVTKLEELLTNTSCGRDEDTLPKYIEAIGGIEPFFGVMKRGPGPGQLTAAVWLRFHLQQYPRRTREIVLLFMSGLHSEDPHVRSVSAEGLGTLAGSAANAVPELENALNDPDAEVRRAAAGALSSIRQAFGPGRLR